MKIGLREAAQQRYVSQEKVVNPGEGGGRGAVVYGADQQMVLHQHQAKNCKRTLQYRVTRHLDSYILLQSIWGVRPACGPLLQLAAAQAGQGNSQN